MIYTMGRANWSGIMLKHMKDNLKKEGRMERE